MTPTARLSSVPYRLLVAICSLIVLILVQVACDESGGGGTVKETVSSDWVRVYFTSPRYPDDDAYHHGGLDEELASVIKQAETSVDVAAYDFDLTSVADALIEAHRQGVRVRFITDSDSDYSYTSTNCNRNTTHTDRGGQRAEDHQLRRSVHFRR